jgi:hypothetical protein
VFMYSIFIQLSARKRLSDSVLGKYELKEALFGQMVPSES